MCLVYAPKRICYSYEGMVVRTILAIIDHNSNVGREAVGEKMKYSKPTKEYRMQTTYEEKDDTWRRELVQNCVKFVTDSHFIEFNPDWDAMLMPLDIPQNTAVGEKPSVEALLEKKYKYKKKEFGM